MTVGELVTQRMLIKARQCGSGGTTGPEQTIGRVLIAPQQALRSLGIWDAEVLEGEYSGLHARLDGDLSFEGIPFYSDLDALFQHHVMSGKREGRFRIIVLPAKEG